MSIQNYRNYPGFRMNKEDYTAYKHEEEVVLMEGIRMFVMKVEEKTINIPTSSPSSSRRTPEQRENAEHLFMNKDGSKLW